MSTETRDILLYGKPQDGLRIDLVSKTPATQSYRELCLAAKNEERWLAELQRKEQYTKESLYYETEESIQQQVASVKKDDRKSSTQSFFNIVKSNSQICLHICLHSSLHNSSLSFLEFTFQALHFRI